jgi:hypothetical protein
LRNTIDVTVSLPRCAGGGVNTDIQQALLFVGREEEKSLAMRQLEQLFLLKPPVIAFVHSQERAKNVSGYCTVD